MKSPITGKEMKLVQEQDQLIFRKEEFQVMYHYYLCEDSGEQFTDERLDKLNLAQVHNQYREKYGIPFPEEIRHIREQYGISASKMSEILGMGVNTYRLYENGEMPTVANGRLILSVRDPDEFIRQVEASVRYLQESEVEKLTAKAFKLIKERESGVRYGEPAKIELRQDAPNAYNGYRRLDLPRVAQVIAYLDNKAGELYKTKLNKLLFYIDFLAYKCIGNSIMGLQYRAIPYGPVPSEYERLFLRLQDEGWLSNEERQNGGEQFYEVYHADIAFEGQLFTGEEIKVIDTVAALFKKKKTSEIVDLSHTEQAWIDNEQNRALISYQEYAFGLKI
ncbi:DUF4065 domain-containing protein [Sphingobacterium sp. SGG-5]|uniref:type II toxin-antitoxin system antitoxin SocA domain-containing protein n=1 Tax=Sphingobacterium sp. SGG-5 TaxID=2710881 RepID=UPI0013ECDB23|nr:type II toxin-antitoxin system antitoxin SocA domain-containing protein [Sphingobacterium sp. SGG-5]NGM60908.1 DUF4065 domain-containing protein [Sphingobacterium sp. SGG-5]